VEVLFVCLRLLGLFDGEKSWGRDRLISFKKF
jgi:hypothetical protein